MKTPSDTVCEWEHCEGIASKHVWYGLRVRDTAGRTPLSSMSYTTDHRDLCAKHTAEVSRRYVHVTQFELEPLPVSADESLSVVR